MKPIWHYIVCAPSQIWALYKNEQPEKTVFDPNTWDTPLLGFIVRQGDGSWECFVNGWVGNEPNKIYAMIRVYNKSVEPTASSKRLKP